jgi:hypothetical protein
VNRFAAVGLLSDAIDGKRIAIVGVHARDVHDGFRVFEDILLEAERPCSIIRSNGSEAIRFPSGGRILFWPARTAHQRARGHELDLVFVDAGADAHLGMHAYVEMQPALAARGGSIVRA